MMPARNIETSLLYEKGASVVSRTICHEAIIESGVSTITFGQRLIRSWEMRGARRRCPHYYQSIAAS